MADFFFLDQFETSPFDEAPFEHIPDATPSPEHCQQYSISSNSKTSSPTLHKHGNVAAIATTKQSLRDNIMAERKRREKLSMLFIALSSLIPGLKKVDKSSVLGDTIEYIKELQEVVKKLEEGKENRDTHSVVKKSQLFVPDENFSSDQNSVGKGSELQLPEFEVRVSENNVLLRIQCQRQSRIMEKALTQIEKLNLTVINTTTLPYGNVGQEITIIAEMDDGFCVSAEELVRNLLSTFGPITA
ncbi:Transcription factor bHLH18 like [Quillaja saponaria]|uniref:Transcription factor bHLH18 like n=1 Tax=Quillaja saponaria TaxID=32244 RepID=A0AAD7P706_QUISA|nr:Transcription factor bHLH18 like [Quillaja saponaria]